MIYLVSPQTILWKSDRYSVITIDEALDILEPLKECECDTETKGLDPYTKALLTIQLGNKDNQIVFDVTQGIDSKLKDYLESDRLFLFWNAQFDLMFMYHYNIWVNHVYDGMLAEQILQLGYERKDHSFSLKDSAWKYLGINIDKTVRGKIINVGLTEEVIIYAAGDVTYLSDIRNEQFKFIEKEHLEKAVKFENEAVKWIAYAKYCGAHLDRNKWQDKINNDQAELHKYIDSLNNWVVNYFFEHGGNKQTMTIKKEVIVDSQFIHEADKLKKLGIKKEELNLRFKDSCYTRPSNNEKLGILYCQSITESFPYLKIDLEGDLWSGFNTDPQCIINWDSPKQLIPFFEMLGFKLDTFDKQTKEKRKTVSAKHIKTQMNVSTIAPLYCKYKDAAKQCQAFGNNWLKAINPISGRIHAEWHQLGTDTARMSSGGGVYKLNLQQLPHDAETRACFTAEPGNLWISCDYDAQESRLLASVANDPAMIELYETGCGDIHSLVAKMSYPNIIPAKTKIEDIKKLYHDQRQDAKGIE